MWLDTRLPPAGAVGLDDAVAGLDGLFTAQRDTLCDCEVRVDERCRDVAVPVARGGQTRSNEHRERTARDRVEVRFAGWVDAARTELLPGAVGTAGVR